MLKKFILLPALALVALLSGCNILAPQLDKAADAAGQLVKFYCENVPSEEVRQEFRAAVNAKAAPHSVNVTCANGTPSLQSNALEGSSHDSSYASSGASPRGSSYGDPVEISQEMAGAGSGYASLYLRWEGGSASCDAGGSGTRGRAGADRTRPQECGTSEAQSGSLSGIRAARGGAEFRQL